MAEALEQGPGVPPIEVLAYHYEQGGEADKVVLYLERAGNAARARYAHAEAAEAYREVVNRLDALGRAEKAGQVREKLGEMLGLLRQYDQALAVLERAVAEAQEARDLERELRSLAKIGWIHRWRGTSTEGLTRLLPHLPRFATIHASQGAAAFFIALAYLYTGIGQYHELLEAAEQAATLARAAGDEALLLVAQERRCGALNTLGRLEEARDVLTSEVLPVGEATGNLEILIDASINLSVIYGILGEFAQGQASLERATSLAERLGSRAQMVLLTHGHGMNAFYLGDWKQARVDLEQAARLAASAGLSWSTAYPSYGLGQLALAEGQDEAESYLAEALMLAERSGNQRLCWWVQGVLAEADLLAGRPAAALARLGGTGVW